MNIGAYSQTSEYRCNLLTATTMLDPKELTNPFWDGIEKRKREGRREREREKRTEREEEGEAPGTLTAALQISEPKSEALMVSSVHISLSSTHSLTHAHARACTHACMCARLDIRRFKPSLDAERAFLVSVSRSLIPSSCFPSPH